MENTFHRRENPVIGVHAVYENVCVPYHVSMDGPDGKFHFDSFDQVDAFALKHPQNNSSWHVTLSIDKDFASLTPYPQGGNKVSTIVDEGELSASGIKSIFNTRDISDLQPLVENTDKPLVVFQMYYQASAILALTGISDTHLVVQKHQSGELSLHRISSHKEYQSYLEAYKLHQDDIISSKARIAPRLTVLPDYQVSDHSIKLVDPVTSSVFDLPCDPGQKDHFLSWLEENNSKYTKFYNAVALVENVNEQVSELRSLTHTPNQHNQSRGY